MVPIQAALVSTLTARMITVKGNLTIQQTRRVQLQMSIQANTAKISTFKLNVAAQVKKIANFVNNLKTVAQTIQKVTNSITQSKNTIQTLTTNISGFTTKIASQ